MLRAPFMKKRTYNLGSIILPKNHVLEGVGVGSWEYRGRWELGVVACKGVVLCGCETGYEVLAEHGAGRGEHEDKQSRRCCAPIIGFATVRPITHPL